MYGYKAFGIDFVNPDFADFAESCGGEGFRVGRPKELDNALELAFSSKKAAPKHLKKIHNNAGDGI